MGWIYTYIYKLGISELKLTENNKCIASYRQTWKN